MGEQNAEDRSCDAGCHRVWARRCVRRVCSAGQWRGHCRIKAPRRPGRASPRLMRTRSAPEFRTLRPRMRTGLVPALSAGPLPPQVIRRRRVHWLRGSPVAGSGSRDQRTRSFMSMCSAIESRSNPFGQLMPSSSQHAVIKEDAREECGVAQRFHHLAALGDHAGEVVLPLGAIRERSASR